MTSKNNTAKLFNVLNLQSLANGPGPALHSLHPLNFSPSHFCSLHKICGWYGKVGAVTAECRFCAAHRGAQQRSSYQCAPRLAFPLQRARQYHWGRGGGHRVPDYIHAPGILEPQKNLIKIKNSAALQQKHHNDRAGPAAPPAWRLLSGAGAPARALLPGSTGV